MKYKKTLVISIVLLISIVAWATPPAGVLFNIILSTGVASDDLNDKVHIDDWKLSLETKGASDFYMQDIAIAPGGYSGWHTHPGIFVGTVITGSIDYYDENCNVKTISAGEVWTEAAELHAIANHGTVDFRGQFV